MINEFKMDADAQGAAGQHNLVLELEMSHMDGA